MERVSVACIVYMNGKVLVARRNPTGDMGGRWEFPGGKREEGESDGETIARELKEEFGVAVKAGEYICEDVFEHSGHINRLLAYRVYVQHDGLKEHYVLTEHSEYAWVKADDIPKLCFVDSDMKLYPRIKEYLKKAQQ